MALAAIGREALHRRRKLAVGHDMLAVLPRAAADPEKKEQQHRFNRIKSLLEPRGHTTNRVCSMISSSSSSFLELPEVPEVELRCHRQQLHVDGERVRAILKLHGVPLNKLKLDQVCDEL